MNLGNISSVVGDISKVEGFLKGLKFPLNKQEILSKAKEANVDQSSQSMLQKIPDKQYPNQSEVMNELNKMR